MAEFLVLKIPMKWESLSPTEIDARGLREKYERRQKVGDIICVKPDGWKWGRKERDGVALEIVKRPDLSVEDMQKYVASDFEAFVVPRPRVKELLTKTTMENIKAASIDNKDFVDRMVAAFETEKARITKVVVKERYTSATLAEIPLDGEMKVMERNDDEGITTKMEAEIDGKMVPISSRFRRVVHQKFRYSIVGGNVFDKLNNVEVV